MAQVREPRRLGRTVVCFHSRGSLSTAACTIVDRLRAIVPPTDHGRKRKRTRKRFLREEEEEEKKYGKNPTVIYTDDVQQE